MKIVFTIFTLVISSMASANALAIEFTPTETAYIAKVGKIKMCVDPDWAPFERINPQGTHEGIAADLVQLVAERVGLRIELHPVKDWEESLAASKNKRCQIMSFLNQTPARDAWLIFTDPIFFDPNVIITREEHGFIADLKGLQGESVALPRGTMVEERVRRDFPNLKVVLTNSEPEAMRLVSDRQADLTIRSLIVAANAIKKEGLFNLKISGQIPEYTNQLRIGVLKDEPLLRAILDKGVKTLTAQEREAISNKHVAINIQQGIDWIRVYVLLALLALATVIALFILRKNRQLKAALAASQEARSALRIAAIAFESQDGMVVTDVKTTILQVNRAFTQLTGYSAQEAVGQTPRMLRSERHDADFYAAMWATVETAGVWHGEIWHQRKNGEVYPEQLTITAVKGEAGEVTHYVGTLRDITLRKQLEKEVAQLAFFDPLTHLPNRRLFNDRLGQALTRAGRAQSAMALMFIDLDKFKPINDAHGHEAGDWVLQAVAKRIEGCLRASDTAARVGGDEFLVLLTDIQTSDDALAVAEKIRLALEQPYVTPSGLTLRASASIGVAVYPEHAQTGQDLLRLGDRAMYQAKNAGGNFVQMSRLESEPDSHNPWQPQ
jgi:diguanylate cyclase (GGDEF)-like protein/PAS domain S-box-containing protein